TLTYGELDRESDRLARELIDRYLVGPDDLVGVLLERSERLIVALLAILKAGGAYVPIDPEYPEERIELMLADIGGRLVLAEGEMRARFAGRVPVLDLLDVRPGLGAKPFRAPRATSRNLAYAMYTSGSTGRPKGVLVEQRSVTRLVRNTNYLELGPGDRILQTGSMSFDASTLEVWGALLNGATLYLAPREELLDATRLGRLLAGQGITCIWLTASLFNQIVDQDLSVFAPLRVLLIGGERLSLHHVNRVRREVPDLAIVNCYGPTENTTFTTCFPVRRAFDTDIPIGRPISHTRVYVLDEENRPVPIGVVGELHCGGDGLARGYLRQPERTAASFVPDPFRDGERMYRTGDLARWSEGGDLEYIGRRDAQVKIRGFRIEPGEIDHRLRELPAVREALTLAREVAGDRVLVTYLVGAPPLAPADLRLHLGRFLPGFMIPSHFVLLDRLPLNPNGKVDLAALPDPAAAGSRSSRVAPRNLLEERLAALWEEVLGVQDIGVEDSFFDLGGHSLKAAAIVARARTELGLDVRLADLFESPTIAGLAACAATESVPSALIPRVPREGELPLSFAQQRMWFLDLWEPGGAAYNLPGAVGLDGPLNVPALAGALAEVGHRHEVLRTTFAAEGGRPLQRIHPERVPAPSLIDLAGLPPSTGRHEAALLAAREAREPFDLARGPLLRSRLLRLAREEHALLLTLHHIAADGWSIGVLIRELQALYAAAVASKPSPLPELAIQYADYAVWQRTALKGGQAEPDLAYWRERLRDLPAVPLPVDRRGSAARSFRGGLLRTSLPPTLARSLSTLGSQAGATLFMTVLTGFQALLARCSGQADIAVGSPVAGRTHREIEPLIGLFVNTLVLRTDLSGDPSVAEL
ncbi:MAG: hypothetical protein QOJ16_3442, partial [Acidobacteriota bacterium]|nr:hypothetical protein [Acidobacteriota bacterium]